MSQKVNKTIPHQDFATEKYHLESMLERDSENVMLLDQLAFVNLNLGLFSESERLLEKALTMMPNLLRLMKHLGIAYLKNKNFSGAEIYFKKVLETSRDDIDLMCHLSIALSAQQKKEEALASLMAVLEISPDHVRARYLCGKLLCDEKLFEEADLQFKLAVPLSEETLTHIIKLFLDQNQFALAKKYAEMLLEKNQNDIDLLYNLGVIETRLNQYLSAAHYYQMALKINPNHFPALNNLAVIYLEQQNISAAKYFFERALSLQPDDVSIQYILSSIEGRQIFEQTPAAHVKNLFDHYAEHFEKHLIQDLMYKTHEYLFELFSVSESSRPLRILDLGCGTGLCGRLFKPLSSYLVGVDLSKSMLAEAREKKCYDVLIEQEMTAYLMDKKNEFDLIIAADVLPYFGNLETLFLLCEKALTRGGHFLFSTEMMECGNYRLQKTGRFSHSLEYINRLASENKLKSVKAAQKTTRKQHDITIPCCLFLLQKS